MIGRGWTLVLGGACLLELGCSSGTVPTTSLLPPLQRILFVGDSFTHGRYLPVRLYNNGGKQNATAGSNLVFDENYGAAGVRAETMESGPFGGIPGIFAEFAMESGLNYDVHIEAISETSLTNNYAVASGVINQPKWNSVVLQELSGRPLPFSLSADKTSDPQQFCNAVQTIEAGVHGVSPAAKVFLYETWAPAVFALADSGSMQGTPPVSSTYASSLQAISNAYHNVYNRAAVLDGSIAGVAPVGDAWSRAWAEGVANPTPYAAGNALPILWYGSQANTPNPPSTGDDRHPSIYGAYLSGLVLFQQITGTDVRTLGAKEAAAAQLGIAPSVATQLQKIAWEAVTQESAAPINQTVDPCSLTH